MRTRLFVSLTVAVALAGCGGGGGSAPSMPSTGANSASPMSIAQASTEAAFANASNAEADQASSNRNVGALSMVGDRSAQSFGNLPYGSCVPDGTYAGMLLSQPVKAGNQTAYDITYYRDPQCSVKARDIASTVTNNGNSSYSIARTATNFDASGNQLSQRASTIAVTGSKDNLSAQSSAVLSFGGSPVGSAMNEWTIAPSTTANVYTMSGDGARVTTTSKNSFGASHAIASSTKTINGDGSSTYAFTSANTIDKGAVGALTITPSSFPGPFTIAPASDAIGSGSLTWTATYDANGLPTNLQVAGTLAMGDTLNITTSAGSPIQFIGTVKDAASASLATFVVDQFGNGSVTFADGTSRQIYDWHAFKG